MRLDDVRKDEAEGARHLTSRALVPFRPPNRAADDDDDDDAGRHCAASGEMGSNLEYLISTLHAAPTLSCWPASVGGSRHQGSVGASRGAKPMLVSDLEAKAAKCVDKEAGWPDRVQAYRGIIAALTSAFPSFHPVFDALHTCHTDIYHSWQSSMGASAEALNRRLAEVAREHEVYFEAALLQALADVKREQSVSESLKKELQSLKTARDGELHALKLDIVDTLRKGVPEEHEVQGLRKLVTGLSTMNTELRERVKEQDEELNRLRAATDGTYVLPLRPLNQMVTQEFMAASRRELDRCRLSTERALLHAANESRSMMQSKVRSLELEMERTKEEADKVRATVADYEAQLHSLRFGDLILPPAVLKSLPAQRSATSGQCDCWPAEPTFDDPSFGRSSSIIRDLDASRSMSSSTVLLATAQQHPANIRCYTPRPRIPLMLQSRLGIDTRQRTFDIVPQLCEAALNYYDELQATKQRLRSLELGLTRCGLDVGDVTGRPPGHNVPSLSVPGLLGSDDSGGNDTDTIKPVPQALWPAVPHFLRTAVSSHIPNERWTAYHAAAICHAFFVQLRELLVDLSLYRDNKMLPSSAKMPPLGERGSASMLTLDASSDEVSATVNAIYAKTGTVSSATPAATPAQANLQPIGQVAPAAVAGVPWGYAVSSFIRRRMAHAAAAGSLGAPLCLISKYRPGLPSGPVSPTRAAVSPPFRSSPFSLSVFER